MIKLIHETHTYVNDEYPNCRYTSVTSMLGEYKEKFDENYHAERVAKRKGLTKEDVIKEWHEIRDQANNYGHHLHSILENFLLAKNRLYSPRDEFEKKVISSFRMCCESNKLNLLNHNDIMPEHIMSIEFNDFIGIAGTSDVIENTSNNTFNVWDFKTNKNFNYDSKYGEYLHFPVNHLQHCEYNDYALQLSIYGAMYEKQTGRRMGRAGLFYWDKHEQTFSLIPICYMKREAEMIISHFESKIVI